MPANQMPTSAEPTSVLPAQLWRAVPETAPVNLIVRGCLVGVAMLIAYAILRESASLARELKTYRPTIFIAMFYLPIVVGARMGYQECRRLARAQERTTPLGPVVTACLVGLAMHAAAWIVLGTIDDDSQLAKYLAWGVRATVYFVPIVMAVQLGYRKCRRQLAALPAEVSTPAELPTPLEPLPPSDNPYAAPRNSQGLEPAPAMPADELSSTLSRDALLSIARRQKSLIGCVLAQVVVVVAALTFADPLRPIALAVTILSISLHLATVVCLGLLATRLHSTFIGVLCYLLVLVPLLAIIVFFLINHQASKLLQRHGFHVGLMGADLDSLRGP
jgi:hypothetical protein